MVTNVKYYPTVYGIGYIGDNAEWQMPVYC